MTVDNLWKTNTNKIRKHKHKQLPLTKSTDKTGDILIMEKKLNAHVQVTYVEQTANEVLGTKAKKLWFIVIETPNGKYQMNVGEKSYEEINRLTVPREEKTVVQVLPPDGKKP